MYSKIEAPRPVEAQYKLIITATSLELVALRRALKGFLSINYSQRTLAEAYVANNVVKAITDSI